MPRQRLAGSPKAVEDAAYSTKSNAGAEQKAQGGAADECAVSVTNHGRDPRLDMARKRVYSSQSAGHRDRRRSDQWSLHQALKLYSSRKRQTADEDNSSLSSERSDKSSKSGTFPTTKGRETQQRSTHDVQRASTRSHAEQRDSQVLAATLEPSASGAKERSASSESSRVSISSSASHAQTPSATARATKRPGQNSSEVHPNTKKRSSGSSVELVVDLNDDTRRKSSSASHRSRSAAALEKPATGVERQHVETANDRDSLTAARPMDRYERVERYLENSNMQALPTTNADEEPPQQSRRQRRQKHSLRASGSHDPSRKALMAAVMAAMPARLRRSARALSDSENESDNNQNDREKDDIAGKQHRRSAKKSRHRSPTDRVKYSFPPFDEPSPEKKRKRPDRPRYESPSSSGSLSTKDSVSENATPPPSLPQPRHMRSKVGKQQQQRRRHTPSESSSSVSSESQQLRDGQRQTAMALARGGSVDSLMPSRNHKLPKSIERNPPAASKFSPDGGRGRRSRNHDRSAAMTKTAERRLDENENEMVINDADKDQWRKYFADLYTFNMLQKVKSTKKHKKKRHSDDMDIDNDDDDDGVEHQNTFYPAPPDTITGDIKTAGFDSIGHSATMAESYPAINYDASHRLPFGSGSLSNVMPPDASSANRALQSSTHRDGNMANSWPNATPVVDEISGRQTLLPPPSKPVPLFALNFSGVMSDVKEVLASRLCCDVCNWRTDTQEAFNEHLQTAEHHMAEMSATPEALTALANKIQTRPMTTMLREMTDPTRTFYCRICKVTTPGTQLDHRRTEEHKKKAGTAKRGCLLCMTGRFDTYPDYITHMDSEDHKQACCWTEKDSAGFGAQGPQGSDDGASVEGAADVLAASSPFGGHQSG